MGHKVEFNSEPFQSHQPVTECSQQEAPLMQREIKLLLAKGAIIPINQLPAYSSSNTRHLHWEATTSRWPYHRRPRRT